MNYRQALGNKKDAQDVSPPAPPKPPVDLQANDKQDQDDGKLPPSARSFFELGFASFHPNTDFFNRPLGANGAGDLPPDYNALKSGPVASNPNRAAPPELIKALKPGDVIIFGGIGQFADGHAEMYLGNGKFASDACQKENFFANADFTQGRYSVYRNTSSGYDANLAVSRIEADSAGRGYGGECAKEVRVAMEAGRHGEAVVDRQVTAAGYDQGVMGANQFQIVATGSGSSVQLNQRPTAAKPIGAHI